jgi:hypothetical protein
VTRGTDSGLLTELRSVDPKPVTLIALETGNVTTPWLRWTDHEQDVVFPSSGGDTYSARPLQVSDVTVDAEDRAGVTVEVADVDADLDTWLLTTDFRYRKLWRYLVERDSLSSTTKAVKDLFRVVARARKDRTVQLACEPLGAILSRVYLPQRVMSREDFPGIPAEGAFS